LQEMLNFTGGLRKLPVLVKDGEVTIGYGGT
jgi:arsenate reductase-like glutaredoxin family protein